MVMLTALACSLLEDPDALALERVEVVPLPAWEVQPPTLDSECGGLLQFCVRELCVVQSADPQPTTGTLLFTLEQKQNHYTRRERVELAANQQATVAATFPEAKLLARDTRGHCEVERTGTRLLCTVANKGRSPREAQVEAALQDKQGATTDSQRQLVTLQPGETRAVRFTFDKVAANGDCSLVR